MQADVALVVGLVVLIFSFPAILGAIREERPPRVAAIAILIGGGLVLYAFHERSGSYTMDQLPGMFMRVVSRFTT